MIEYVHSFEDLFQYCQALGYAYRRPFQRVEWSRKSGSVDSAICSHGQKACILFTGQIEGRVVEMDEIEVMTAITLLHMVSNKRENITDFEEEISDAGVGTAHELTGILNEQRWLLIAGSVR